MFNRFNSSWPLSTSNASVHPYLRVSSLKYYSLVYALSIAYRHFHLAYKAESEAAHRIFAASLLVASKYSEDHYLSTKQLVRATGDVWSIKEMTRMELAFLRFLQWNLHIDVEEMVAFLRDLNFESDLIFPSQP